MFIYHTFQKKDQYVFAEYIIYFSELEKFLFLSFSVDATHSWGIS
jgi:hypothetical protein